MAHEARIADLRWQLERTRAELLAVEDGILPWLEARRECTPTQLAEAFGLSAPGANNRLIRLERVGLLNRSPVKLGSGGRGYIYRIPLPTTSYT